MKTFTKVIRNLFLSSQPIFRVDRRRYFGRIVEAFPDLADFYDTSKPKYEGFEADRRNLAGDMKNVFGDLKVAMKEYKSKHPNQKWQK